MGHRRGKTRGTHTKREPSGRPSRSAVEEAISPTSAKRLRDAAVAKIGDAQWGTEIGRLFLSHKISPTEYAAANKWMSLRVEYYHAIGAPLPWPPPGPIASLGTPGGRSDREDPGITTTAGRKLKDHRLHVESEYQRAHAALGYSIDMLAAFRLTIEDDKSPIGAVGLGNLRYCLSRLARHWGMTR